MIPVQKVSSVVLFKVVTRGLGHKVKIFIPQLLKRKKKKMLAFQTS